MENMNIDIIIPTYKPDKGFIKLLTMLDKQTIKPNRIIVMNTEEKYWDRFLQENPYEECLNEVEVYHLTKQEFNHGATRNEGINKSGADICVVMTMDAIPADEELISNITEPIKEDNMIAASYARQLAYDNSSLIEKMTREFNYPEEGRIQTAADIERFQIKAFFCSNVCCAYNMSIFKKLGGFVERTIFNEDMIYASGAIKSGYKIAYCAKARVFHAHEYGGIAQFKRNFDNGVSHAEYPEVFENIKSEGEGKKMVKTIIIRLITKGHILQAIKYIWISACKYIGFKLGCNYKRLPSLAVRCFTSDKSYFIS